MAAMTTPVEPMALTPAPAPPPQPPPVRGSLVQTPPLLVQDVPPPTLVQEVEAPSYMFAPPLLVEDFAPEAPIFMSPPPLHVQDLLSDELHNGCVDTEITPADKCVDTHDAFKPACLEIGESEPAETVRTPVESAMSTHSRFSKQSKQSEELHSSRKTIASTRSKLSTKSRVTLAHMMKDEGGLLRDSELDSCESSASNLHGGKMVASKKSMAQKLLRGKPVGDVEESAFKCKINVVLRDAENDESGQKGWVLDPNALFCRIWHLLTSAVVIYIIIYVFIDIGFAWHKSTLALYIFNYIVDGYCWLDMAVSFNTGYIHSGHLIMDRKRIAKHYLAFWFWIDLLANVPWEGLLMVDKSNRKAVKFVKWLKLPKLLRIGRLRKVMKANARYLNLMLIFSAILLCMHMGACFWVLIVDPCSAYLEDAPFQDWSFHHEVQDELVARHPRLGWECVQDNLGQIYTQALHISAAALLGVDSAAYAGYISGGGVNSGLLEEVNSYAQYLIDTQESASQDLAAARIRALKLLLLRRRYPLSLSDTRIANSIISEGSAGGCVGHNGINTQPETNTYGLSYAVPMDIFGTIMLLMGLYLQGSLFANLTKMAVTRNQAETSFRQAHDEIKRELDQFGYLIPECIQRRVLKHFEFRWVNQAYGSLQLLNPELLSHSLRSELALYLYKDTVHNVEFLQVAPVAILTRVCLNLQLQYYMMHDVIYRRGEPPTGFYFVEMGRVIITRKESINANAFSMDFDEIHPGDHFGVGTVLAVIQERPQWCPAGMESMMISPTGSQAFHSSIHGTGNCAVLNRKTAIAATVCHLLWMPLEIFQEICDDHPKFFADLKHLCEFEEEDQEEEDASDDCARDTVGRILSMPLSSSRTTAVTSAVTSARSTIANQMKKVSVISEKSANNGIVSTATLPGELQESSELPEKGGEQLNLSGQKGWHEGPSICIQPRESIPSSLPSGFVPPNAQTDLLSNKSQADGDMQSLGVSRTSFQSRLSSRLSNQFSARPSLSRVSCADLEQQISELEQAVDTQTKKLNRAMDLLTDLLDALAESNL